MGKAKIRRWRASEGKWTDKTCARHKHVYSVHATACIYRDTGFIDYYDVMRCTQCNSFHCIPREGSMLGSLREDEVDRSLPTVNLYTPHKWLIGFKDAILKR